jgi:hypothetical protein
VERDKQARKKLEREHRAPAERGLPPCSGDSPRLTAHLRSEEVEALAAFAKARHWTISTAIRAILRERLLDDGIPF